ncbi:FxSxx-COOH cyclophane-containing RiPP peptide [Streptomyces sp. NPDC048680]|uniref:FxSxx-COOH cyclophane-containing RiPP peptide n=1 Tax=Streptomyces sp. NPDC048680 TaxID=3155492 RepID=UPI003438E463
MSRNKASRTAVKTYATSPSFANAKKSRVPLTEIDARGADASRKLGRVFGTSAGRSTQTSTFSSAL